MAKPISVGQIMAEILCINDLDEVESAMYSTMGDCFNALSFELRSKILANIDQYLRDCGVEVTE